MKAEPAYASPLSFFIPLTFSALAARWEGGPAFSSCWSPFFFIRAAKAVREAEIELGYYLHFARCEE